LCCRLCAAGAAAQAPIRIHDAIESPLYVQSTVAVLMNPELRQALLLECRSGMQSWYSGTSPEIRAADPKRYPLHIPTKISFPRNPCQEFLTFRISFWISFWKSFRIFEHI
jgi:hypothetical protein